MRKPEEISAAIDRARITDMRAYIAPSLPGMTIQELYEAWIDAIQGVANFAGDAAWLDLVELEYQRRGIEPGSGTATHVNPPGG
jgi:hypothetical protein